MTKPNAHSTPIVRISQDSKRALVDAAQVIGSASGKEPHLSDIVDELVHRALPGIVRAKVAALRTPVAVKATAEVL